MYDTNNLEAIGTDFKIQNHYAFTSNLHEDEELKRMILITK